MTIRLFAPNNVNPVLKTMESEMLFIHIGFAIISYAAFSIIICIFSAILNFISPIKTEKIYKTLVSFTLLIANGDLDELFNHYWPSNHGD